MVAGNALIERALEISPDLPIAYAAMAEGMVRSTQARPGHAKEMALKALALDPDCGQCLATAGWVLMSKEWEWKQSLAYLNRAAWLMPRDPRVRMWHAQILAVNGKLTDALREVDVAIELQPAQAPSEAMRTGILYLQQRYDEAILSGRKALAYQPSYTTAMNWLYRSYGQQRKFSDALAVLASSRRYFTGASADAERMQTVDWQSLLNKRGIGEWVRTQLESESGLPSRT